MSGNLDPGAGISGQVPGGGQAWGGKVLPILPDDIKVITLGGGFYQLDFPRILQTAAVVTSSYAVPFPHILAGLFVKHVDASLAGVATSLTFKAKFALRENLNFALAAFTSVSPDEAFLFRGNEGAKNATNYIFETNTTNTHWVYISMVIQALGMI